jgi:hypothetical protein
MADKETNPNLDEEFDEVVDGKEAAKSGLKIRTNLKAGLDIVAATGNVCRPPLGPTATMYGCETP